MSIDQWPMEAVVDESVNQPCLALFDSFIQRALESEEPTPVAQILSQDFGIGERQAANIARMVDGMKADSAGNPGDFFIYQILTADLQRPVERGTLSDASSPAS